MSPRESTEGAATATAVEPGERVPFNVPFLAGSELDYVREAIANVHLSGNGPFSERCTRWLEELTGARRALLTHSGTGALEMAAILAEVEPGDEVLMPSFTFVSTANAFVLRGATPVFVDVRADTLNLDESLVEAAIGPRTRAIVPVHYAGVGCEMDAIAEIAARHGLTVIEDAAQGAGATYRGRPLGGIGAFGALSFHETKNLMCGEGGALLVNDPEAVERAEIIHEKGTDRRRFARGEVDRYTWRDVGSSFLISEIAAAFLWAQLESAEQILARRRGIWERYHAGFAELEAAERLRRPIVPPECEHNGHLYYLLLGDRAARDALIAGLDERGIGSVFHYVPLHSAEAGRRFGRAAGELPQTDAASERLVRLPLWAGMNEQQVDRVVSGVAEIVG